MESFKREHLHASRAAIISVLAAMAEAEVDINAAGDQLAELMCSSDRVTDRRRSPEAADASTHDYTNW
jgi:hypothetical protein